MKYVAGSSTVKGSMTAGSRLSSTVRLQSGERSRGKRPPKASPSFRSAEPSKTAKYERALQCLISFVKNCNYCSF